MKHEFGEKIRAVRQQRGATLKQIALLAGVSESMLSQIERNRISPAIDTLLRVADALDIDFDYLFQDLKKDRMVNVVRQHERHKHIGNGVTYERLTRTPDHPEEHGIEGYFMSIEPGCSSGNKQYGHPGKELGTLIEGSGQLSIGCKTIQLEPGDSISFASDAPHQLKNIGTTTLKAFWITTPPKRLDS